MQDTNSLKKSIGMLKSIDNLKRITLKNYKEYVKCISKSLLSCNIK
jgi:hypothetical protein